MNTSALLHPSSTLLAKVKKRESVNSNAEAAPHNDIPKGRASANKKEEPGS
jgi:hypothetical protein